MAELLLATLYLVSEAPPDKSTDLAAEPKAEVAPAEPDKPESPPATGALADAAQAMDAAEKKAESAAPIAPPAADPTAPAPTAPPTTAVAPSPAANTSGMHLQYVAPGVRRQSMLESTKWQIGVMAAMLIIGFLMLRGGLDGLSGGLATGSAGGGGPTPVTTNLGPPQSQTATDDTSYQPIENRTAMPVPDLTVNAGAIGGTRLPTLRSHVDAGANKGGYANERADLDAAEAMVPKDPDKALALVDKHDRDYPRGILDPDARIIRIEAFQKKGDDAKALALADEFLQDYPHFPAAGRVQTIAEQIKNKTGGGGTAPP